MTWHPDIPEEYRNQIVGGDARDLSLRIPDESIDMIFTDPPYLNEYIHLYEWLAQEAYRVLKPGGWLFAYGGAEFTPKIISLMSKSELRWFWEFHLYHSAGYPRMWNKQLMSGYKPIFVYTKGWPPNRIAWQSTVFTDKRDKKYHEWGQGIGFPIKTIELLTNPNDVIFDPFMGGGTTAVACKIAGRNFVGFEIDYMQADLANVRYQNAQPPLFILEPEQLSLEEESV